MNLFADTIAPVRRSKSEELFLIRIVAKPRKENPEASEFGGAYAVSWVNVDELRVAVERAVEFIEHEGWQPIEFDHWELVNRRLYIDDPGSDEEVKRENLERLDEAIECGISLTFHCWPPNAPDA